MEPTEEIFDNPVGWVAEHIRRYVESGGKDGQVHQGAPVLLLTTRGRRTGKLRRTPLIYGRHGDGYVVVASKGGAPAHPQWYRNLVADPRVYLQVGAQTFAARARTATGEERSELWRMMTGVFPPYASYQKMTDREIPVVVLDPANRS